jgi:hypothetical protein
MTQSRDDFRFTVLVDVSRTRRDISIIYIIGLLRLLPLVMYYSSTEILGLWSLGLF